MAGTITGSAQLSNEVKTLYDADFLLACQSMLYWDQFANLRMQMNGTRGKYYEFPIVESLQPQYNTLDELADVTPQQLNVNAITTQLYEYGGAVELTKYVEATSYSDVLEQAALANGYNLAESLDYVSRAWYGQGGRQIFQNGQTARSGFAGQTVAADRLTAPFMEKLAMLTRVIKMPLYDDGFVMTVMHHFPWYDLLQDTTVRGVAQRLAPEILFNGEVAAWGGVRIVVSSAAKAFWGVGAVLGTNYTSTMTAAGAVGDTTLTVGTNTNCSVGQVLAIQDGAESGNTWYDTNEAFVITAKPTSTTLTGYCLDPGPGDGGGLRFAHASGTAITNANSVYPIVCFGPNSVTKIASDYTGPYGETVVTGPFDRLGRFVNIGFYALVGYSRTRTGWIVRGECGSSTS